MTLPLIGLAIAALLELVCALTLRLSKRLTTIIIAWTVLLLAVCSTAALLERPNISLILVWMLSLYKIINLLRLNANRLQPNHLRRITLRTSLALTIAQACLLIMWVLVKASYFPDRKQWILLTGLLTLAGVCINSIISARMFIKPTATAAEPLLQGGLPTVSVLIPARNETDALEACLDGWVASDYPKLEIIVLDDCSQLRRTPEIIRQYAHDGIRFIPGKLTKEGWLAKNQAYDELAREATGELLVFCGVDARVQPDSLRLLAADFYAESLQMAAVLPRNYLQAGKVSALQLLRYGRELMRLPWAEQPPVLSTLWLISAATLSELGGFAAVKRSVLPEMYFSRVLKTHKAYQFWVGPDAHQVASSKQVSDQYDTAVRTLYPSFHRQIEVVAVVSLVGILVTFFPPLMLIAALFSEDWLLALIAFLGVAMMLASYRMVLEVTYGEAKASHVYGWPIAVINWLRALHYSLYKYEFSVVEWKGRNICVPVMDQVTRAPLAQVRHKYRKR
jgi:glycosyltransferase involved in cell wall biosynthesis